MYELLEVLEDVPEWSVFSTFWSLLRPENKEQAAFNLSAEQVTKFRST